MGSAVKEQKPKKMSLLSRKLFSLFLLVALAVSATASPVEERGFFRLQCYSTCQAASFASTTSCTFGGFFWSTTLTCAQIFPVLSANSAGRSLEPTKALAPAAQKPQERGFFRLQCYSTCQAVSFASTTSCTFGGFFWRTTLTCAQIFPVLAANQDKLVNFGLRQTDNRDILTQ